MTRVAQRQEQLAAQLGGLWLGLWPVIPALVVAVRGLPAVLSRPALQLAVMACGLCLLGAGLGLTRWPRQATLLSLAGLTIGALASGSWAIGHPALVLLLASLAVLILAAQMSLWRTPVRGARPGAELLELRLQVCAVVASVVWFALVIGHLGSATGRAAVIGLSALTVAPLSAHLLRRMDHAGGRWRGLLVTEIAAIGAASVAVALGRSPVVPLGALLLAPALLCGWSAALLRGGRLWWSPLFDSPARMLVSTFALLSLLGGLLLAMPSSAAGGQAWGLLDATFTSVSAACVTGLIVHSTPHQLSPSGQLIVLALIQLGGLGIMTLSTAALAGLGRRLSLRHELAMAELLSGEDQEQLFTVLGRLLKLTVVAELVGTALLWPLFARGGEGWLSALWRALFTAVSAFCNAGFALQDDSLVGYASQPLVLHVVAALIILGGLSPLGVVGLPRLLRRRRVSLQVKLVLVLTGALLGLGWLGFAALEWQHSLAGLSLGDKLHNAWFQSVTARTAGFNSVPLDGMHPATLLLLEGLMFVGGSPGGTAGGIKTTTLAILALSVLATVRGQGQIKVFGRRLGERTVARAWAITAVSVILITLAFAGLLLTQSLPPSDLLFEVVSALGTVGLSRDLTSQLDGVGETLIMLCMFAGRVGPLSLFLLLTDRPRRDPVGVPVAEVDVG